MLICVHQKINIIAGVQKSAIKISLLLYLQAQHFTSYHSVWRRSVYRQRIESFLPFAFCLIVMYPFSGSCSLFLLSKHFRGEHGFSFFHLEFWSGIIELLFILLYQPIYMSQKHFLRNAKMGNVASDELSGLLVIELGNLGSKISHYDAKWIHMLFWILLKRVLFSVFSFT